MTPLRNATRLVGKWVQLNRDAFVTYRERRGYVDRDPKSWGQFRNKVFTEQSPIFVLSTGRCGTKLLTQLLEKVPATACFHAPQPELLSYEKLAYEQGESNFEAFKLLISACRFELMADCFVRGRRYIETNQRITFFAPHLYELFPQARFIHLVRNPYSFVRTGAALNYYEGQYADLGRITPIEGPAAIQWPHMSIYQRCAWLWNETNEFIERFKAKCDPSRVLTVLAEDLFDNPETTLTILRHCGLSELPISTISKCLKRKVNSNPHKGKLNRVDQDDQKWKDAIQPWSLNASRYHYAM